MSNSSIERASEQAKELTSNQQSILDQVEGMINCANKQLRSICEMIDNSPIKTETVAILKQGQKVLHRIEDFGAVMTEYKFKYLNSFNYDTRMTTLLALTMLNGVWAFSRRSSKIIGVDQYGRAMRTIKIAGITYFLGGLMLTPEIYNPVMVKTPKVL